MNHIGKVFQKREDLRTVHRFQYTFVDWIYASHEPVYMGLREMGGGGLTTSPTTSTLISSFFLCYVFILLSPKSETDLPQESQQVKVYYDVAGKFSVITDFDKG